MLATSENPSKEENTFNSNTINNNNQKQKKLMKQKLFSILALLLMAVTGAWAADKVLINFPTADTGIGVAGTSTKSTVKVNKNTTTLDSYKLANGYNSGGSYTGNSIVLSVDGGFKKGDVITIAGAINNSDASKRATAVLFTLGASENITILNIFSDFINGQLVETMPVEESYTLETDAETLYLGRDGGTGANLTTIKVVRPAPAGLTTYSVTLADGTEDADNWTISPASAAEGETVTITYNGTKRVKSVTAVKKAAAPRPLAEATAEDLGKIAGADGNIYDSKDAASTAGTTAVAMIAYVGGSTGHATYTHGLAIALADESSSNWSTAKSTCEGKSAVTNAAWLLPSLNQWMAMFKAFGGNEGSYSGLNTAITKAGGTALKEGEYPYWASTPFGEEDYAWTVILSDGNATPYDDEVIYEDRVRACLAF